MGTMVGIGPSSSDFRESEVEPVYLLTRRRSSFPPPPSSSAVPSLPLPEPRATEVSVIRRSTTAPLNDASIDEGWDDAGWDEDSASSDDLSDVDFRHFARRRRWMRVFGAFAIVGALAGGTFVLQKPQVRHEALSFVTMGHEDAALRLGHRLASVVERLRHR